ncbi:MAG TPA: helix-turn-helix domain-containing protein [Terriglobales bacterium]|nr:helix-turn-helix domain-containing protein [Terriglobales bacterium]
MSQKEWQRVKVIENAVEGRLRVSEAARLLQLSERQVQRLKRRYRPDSIAWVHHGNRGRPMPWALPVALRQTILRLARGKYAGFNDSHLCEKLHSEEHLSVSRETVRRILRQAKLASPQKRRARQYRARRLRRPRFGMMVLTDASRHDWLQGRGPELTSSAFRMTPPAKSSPLTSRSNRKTLSAISALCTPWSLLTASPSASTVIAMASFSATIPTGLWPNNSPENNLPPN